jgi:site-specific DNA-methyltransferase (adenine-specific)
VKPYYQDASVTLYHGDALEMLPLVATASVDAVVTDPPYLATGSESSWVSRDGASSLPRETQFYEAWLREHMAVWKTRLKPTGAIWFTCDWRGALAAEDAAYKLGMKRPKIGVWHREGLGMGHVLRNVYECFVVIPMPDFKRLATDEPDVWVHKWTTGQRQHGHSAEKPIALMARAVRLLTKDGATVLDPFAGSGSVLVASRRLSRKCIAFEREEAYCEIAARRLSQGALTEMFASS